jgi:hypothetical protein
MKFVFSFRHHLFPALIATFLAIVVVYLIVYAPRI